MADLDFTDASQPVEITDGMNMGNSAQVRTGTPTSTDGGLVVREAARGQQTPANSIPVVLAESPGNPAVDATGASRTVEAFTLFDSKFTLLSDNLLWTDLVAGAGTDTFNTNLSSFDMTVGTASGDRVLRRSRQYVPYQAGKPNQAYISGVLGSLKTNVRQRIGLYDSNNGLFFEQDGTNLKVVRRTNTSGSPVDNAVAQSSWNLDPMDGTGQSGITIDLSQFNVFIIDYQWLGGGLIRFGFLIGGIIYYCHQIITANTIATPWAKRGSFPVTYEIENTGTAASSTTMIATCASVQTTGGLESFGFLRSVNSGIGSGTSIDASETPIISLRLDPNSLQGGIEVLNISLFAISGKAVRFRLVWNGSLTAPSWTDVSAGTSIAEFDTAATAITGGEVLASGYTNQNIFTQIVSADTQLPILGSNTSGTPDHVTVVAYKVEAGAAPAFFATIDYKEYT